MSHAAETLLSGAEYELLAGPGAGAYRLRCKPEQRVALLEGEDAARFRADLETVQQQFPGCTADQALAQLWDQGGYSWLAAEEEE